uniref:Uncharacterized protein n=1 Tax=Timema bartmani TaxID=61472 RepID=A0A7R9EQG0_9NEOP|nr:unnamed protein product [Timema bartmani]
MSYSLLMSSDRMKLRLRDWVGTDTQCTRGIKVKKSNGNCSQFFNLTRQLMWDKKMPGRTKMNL